MSRLPKERYALEWLEKGDLTTRNLVVHYCNQQANIQVQILFWACTDTLRGGLINLYHTSMEACHGALIPSFVCALSVYVPMCGCVCVSLQDPSGPRASFLVLGYTGRRGPEEAPQVCTHLKIDIYVYMYIEAM